MKKIKDYSIKSKLQAIIIFASLVSVGISVTFVSIQSIRDFRNDQMDRAKIIVKMTGDYCAADLMFADHRNAGLTLGSLTTVPEVYSAALYDENDNLFAIYGDSVFLDFPGEIPKQASRFYEQERLHLFEPIEFGGEKCGTIYLSLTTRILDKKIRDYLVTMLTFLIFLILFAVILSRWLQKIISQPILNLARTTQEIAEREDYSVKVKSFGKDEIGELYNSFNLMLDQIHKRDMQRTHTMYALKESEGRYRKLIELSPNGIVLHQNGKIVFTNKAVLKLAGASDPKEVLGFDIFDLFHPESKKKIENDISRMQNSTERVPFAEAKLLNIDNDFFDVLVSSVPFGGHENKIILTVIQDMSDFKEAERALIQSEQRFRQIIEKSNDGMYVVRQNKFVMANPKMESIFGYTGEEFLSNRFSPIKLVAEESLEFIAKRMEANLKDEFTPAKYQFKGVTKTGKIIDLDVNLTQITWDGNPAILGILRDITQQNLLEEQLRQSQKMEAIGTLAGGVAHDFNNLLTVISGHVELMQLKIENENPLNKHILEIGKAGQRAQDLTRQLLTFSRKQIIQPKLLNANEIIHEMHKMLIRLIGEDISLVIDLNDEIPLINADHGQIEQIMMNLVVNARDAINENTIAGHARKILVSTTTNEMNGNSKNDGIKLGDGKFVVLSVTDSGVGMDNETIDKIFEPFFTTKGVGKGTGLGLATIYGIVKQNAGDIVVSSVQGEGTTFKIYWPVSEKTHPQIEENTKAIEKPKEGTESILFVEDDKSVREFAVVALEELGYTIHEAKDARHALRMIEEDKITFDLLITDLVMPEMSGKELVDVLERKIDGLKVLYASGYIDGKIGQDGVLEKGINFIHKPYSVKELTEKIHALLAD